MSQSHIVSRSVVFLLLSFLCAFSSLAQNPPTHQHPPIPSTDSEQYIAYWTSETGWMSELQLRNNLIGQDLTVTPALRLADGDETVLAPVTIKPQEVKSIEIDPAIASAAAPQLVGTFGSVVLRYRSPSSGNLYAAMMIRRTGYPVAFHIDAIGESQELQVGAREGVWWLPNDTASDYLILTNQGGNTIPLTIFLYDAVGRESKQEVSLGPREVTRYSVRKLLQTAQLKGSYGSIKISTPSHAGSLDTLHFLFDEKAAFSAILKMFDYNPNATLEERDFAKTGVWTLRAPMLALSNPDPALAFPPGTTLRPQLFVHNTSGKPLDAGLRFVWRADKQRGNATVPALRLNPNETRLVDVGALQNTGVLPKQANWASVMLTINGSPDEVMAVAASYDDTLHYGSQTPFSDQLSHRWEGGMWEYDHHHSSIITAGNGGSKTTEVAFTIFYNEGAERYELDQTLRADEQMWVDVGRLIREQVPDKNGKTLPQDLTMGSYEFRDLTNNGVGALFEGKVIYDKTYGHATYGCATCCGYTAPLLIIDPVNLTVGASVTNGVNALSSCDGVREDVSSYFYSNWSTANTNVATVDFFGTHTGVSAGSTTYSTSGSLQGPYRRNCPLQNYGRGGTDNVTTPSQHTYPSPPLTGCQVKVPFDGIIVPATGKKHQAQDTGSNGIVVGTPVYAPEAGKITNFVSGKPHDARPVSQCAGQNSPANFIEIQSDSDGALTRLYHVTILTALATKGTHVAGGQQIGTIDISGCTSAPHTHIQRKVNGVLVNFTMPCDNSHFDDPSTYYDDSDGTW